MMRLPEQSTHEQEIRLPFESWLSSEFPRQYEINVSLLKRVGLLELLPEVGRYGIIDIDGKKHPLPTEGDIETAFQKEREKYSEWMRKGFTNFKITPFGVPIKKIISIVAHRLTNHHRDGLLFSGEEKIPLNEAEPVRVWGQLLEGDINGTMKYLMSEFGNDHGYTKQQILNFSRTSFPGFRLFLQEDILHIPRQGRGRIVGGRKQIEANQTASEYLHLFREEGTKGLTPEDSLTAFIIHLEQTNKIMDDLETESGGFCVGAYCIETAQQIQGRDLACYCGVPYHEPNGHIPDIYWNREEGLLQIGGGPPTDHTPRIGARPIIEIGTTLPLV